MVFCDGHSTGFSRRSSWSCSGAFSFSSRQRHAFQQLCLADLAPGDEFPEREELEAVRSLVPHLEADLRFRSSEIHCSSDASLSGGAFAIRHAFCDEVFGVRRLREKRRFKCHDAATRTRERAFLFSRQVALRRSKMIMVVRDRQFFWDMRQSPTQLKFLRFDLWSLASYSNDSEMRTISPSRPGLRNTQYAMRVCESVTLHG